MDAEAYGDLERRLVARVRSAGPLRAALAQLAHWLIGRSAWERLGYVRLSDYADERIGLSARSLQDLAHVGGKLEFLPRLRQALVRGQLGWTKVRLLARVAHMHDEERWIAYADRVTSATLSRELRKVDVGSLEGGAVERDRSRSHWFEVPCTLEVRAKWFEAQRSARRVHGGRVSPATCLEMVSAEVLSALPIDPDLAPEPEAEWGMGAREARALVASGGEGDDALS